MTKNFNRPKALKMQLNFVNNTLPLLQQKEISFGDLARKFDMTTAAISRYYSLERKMDVDIMFGIAEMLGENVTDLINEKPE